MNAVAKKGRGRPKGSKNKPKESKIEKFKIIKLMPDIEAYKKLGLIPNSYKAFEIPTNRDELEKGDRVLIADGREGEFISADKGGTCTIRMDDSKLYSIKNECIRKKGR